MPNTWQEAYSKLTDFIAEHPEVEIEATRRRLPDNVRPEFYRLFSAVRTAFIGICAGRPEEWPIVVVVENCQFLPPGLVPLPLPGGPVVIIRGY